MSTPRKKYGPRAEVWATSKALKFTTFAIIATLLAFSSAFAPMQCAVATHSGDTFSAIPSAAFHGAQRVRNHSVVADCGNSAPSLFRTGARNTVRIGSSDRTHLSLPISPTILRC
jgi:hypothetical protein